MVDSANANEWFVMARKDIKAAKILLEHEADSEMVCFHCQQAIEKYLTGYLVDKSGRLQDGHNLVKLCKQVMLYNEAFAASLKDMAFVETFGDALFMAQ